MRENIESHLGSEWVRNLEEKPDKMLRVLPLDSKTPEELKESLDVLKRGEGLFRNLRDNYGISVPDMQTLIQSNDDGTSEARIEVDKIEGINLEDAERLSPEAGDGLDKFYFALANHYWDVFRNGGDYWFDFRDDQLMYGHKSGGKEDSVYVVDVDPEYQTYDRETKAQGKRLLKLLGRIYESVDSMESRVQPAHKFENTRKFLSETFSQIPQDEPYYDEYIRKPKDALEKDQLQTTAA